MTTKESKTFVSLWLRKDLSDVTLKLESQEIEVHKMVLAAGSEYFNKLFFGSFAERDLAEVELKEDNENAVKIVVFWLYGIEDELRPSLSKALRPRHDRLFWVKELIDIYIVADKYCVHDLVDKVIENLQQEFSTLDLAKFTAFIDLIYTNRDNYPDKLSERVDSELLGPTISQCWDSLVYQARFMDLFAAHRDFAAFILRTHPDILRQYVDSNMRQPGGLITALREIDGLAFSTLEELVAFKGRDRRAGQITRDRLAKLIASESFKKAINEDKDLAIEMLKCDYYI